MRKQILTACAIIVSSVLITTESFGQWNTSSTTPVIEAGSGFDEIQFLPSQTAIRTLRGETTDGYLQLYSGHDGSEGPGLHMYSNSLNTTSYPWGSPGMLSLWSTGGNSANNSAKAFEVIHYNSNSTSPIYSPLLTINKSGFIGIGIDPSTDYNAMYRLRMRGNILLESPWPNSDYGRSIVANTSTGSLGLIAGTNGGDGSFITMAGNTYDAQTNEHPGLITFNAYAAQASGNNDELAYSFMTYHGQQYGWVTRMLMNKHGNIGIGANPSTPTSPDGNYRLNIEGAVAFEPSSSTTYREIAARAENSGLNITSNTGWSDGSGILLNAKDNGGNIAFVATNGGNNNDPAFTFWTNEFATDVMAIQKDGKVRIGSAGVGTSSNNYKLFVETGIMTGRIKVATVNGAEWSDYVFDDAYKLKSLNDVAGFIAKNKHLPDVPSACDVEQNGYDVTKMDATLLQKIEELTLYIIQQQKQIDELNIKLNK